MTKSSKHKAQNPTSTPANEPRRSSRVSQTINKQVTNQPAKRNPPTDERKNSTLQQLILQKTKGSQNSKKFGKQLPCQSKTTTDNKPLASTTNTSSLAQHQKGAGRLSQEPTVSLKKGDQKFEGDLTIIECPEELAPRRVLTMDQSIADGLPKTRSKISSISGPQTKPQSSSKEELKSSKDIKAEGESSPEANKAVTANEASQLEVSPHIQDINCAPIVEIQKDKKGSSAAGKTTTQGNSASRVGDFISKMEIAEETTKMQQSHTVLETNSVHDIAANTSIHYLKPINIVANARQRLSSVCTDNLLEDDTEFKRPLEPGSPARSLCPQSYTGNADDNSRPISMHPLVQVIDDFTSQRQLAIAPVNNQRGDCSTHQIQKPRIEDFIARFENEMKVTEHAYKNLKAQKKKSNELYQKGLSNASFVQQPSRNNQFGQMQPSTTLGYIGTNSMQLSNNSPNLPQFGSLMSIRPPLNPSAVSDNNVSGQVSVGLDTTSQLEQYEAYRFQPNQLMPFYPKSVQKLLARRSKLNSIQQTSERLTANLKAPQVKFKDAKKSVNKLRNLVLCQTNFMQVLLQKIDRRSKPIKKQEKALREGLRRKRIYLEEENFDIIGVLKQAIKSQPDSVSCGPDAHNGSKYEGTKNYQLAQCDELQQQMRKDALISKQYDSELQQSVAQAECKSQQASFPHLMNNQTNLYSFKKSGAMATSQQKSRGSSNKKQLNVDFQQSRNKDCNSIVNIAASNQANDSKSDLIRAHAISEAEPASASALNLTATASEQFKTAEAKVKEAFRLSEIGDTIFQPLHKLGASNSNNQMPIELPQTPRLASESIPQHQQQQKASKPTTPQSFKSPPRTIAALRKTSLGQEQDLGSDINQNELVVKQKSSVNSKTQKPTSKQISVTGSEGQDNNQLKSQKSSQAPATTSQKRKSKSSKGVQQAQAAPNAQSVIEGRDLGSTFAEMIDVGGANGNFSLKFRLNASNNATQQQNDSSLNNGTDTTGPGTDSCLSAINNTGTAKSNQQKVSRQKSNNGQGSSGSKRQNAEIQESKTQKNQQEPTQMNQQMNIQMESTQTQHLMPSEAMAGQMQMQMQQQYEPVTSIAQMQNYFLPQANNLQTYNMHQGQVQFEDMRFAGTHLHDISSSILNKTAAGLHSSFLHNLSNEVDNILIDEVMPRPTGPVSVVGNISNSAFYDKQQSSVGHNGQQQHQQQHQTQQQQFEDFIYRQQQLPPTPAACIIPQGIDLNLHKSQSHHPFGLHQPGQNHNNNVQSQFGNPDSSIHQPQNQADFSIEHFIADSQSQNAQNQNHQIGAFQNLSLGLPQSHSMVLPSSAQKTSSNEQVYSFNNGVQGQNQNGYASMMMDVDGLPGQYSNVANPYQAAKRRYMREQQQQLQLAESNKQKGVNENSTGQKQANNGTCKLMNTVTPLNLHTSPDNCKNAGGMPDMATMMLQPFTVNQNERAGGANGGGALGSAEQQISQSGKVPTANAAAAAAGPNANQNHLHVMNQGQQQQNGTQGQQVQSCADFKLSASSALKNSAAMGACMDSAGPAAVFAAGGAGCDDEEMIGGEVEHSMKIDINVGAIGHHNNINNQQHGHQHTDVPMQPHNHHMVNSSSLNSLNRHHHLAPIAGGGLRGVVSAWSTTLLDQGVDNEQNWGYPLMGAPPMSPRYLQPYSSNQID